MKAANRIIFNTGVLYAGLLIRLLIGLFTTRFVLQAMGETDYGIYMLVAGVVGMLNILNSNMANTSMRFMSVSLGKGDKIAILKTFNTTLYIHFIIGAIVVVLMEVGGWLMFEYLLNIPAAKVFDAKVVFQFMIITTFITVISVPYDAVMNAHERIYILTIIDTFGSFLKLGLAIYLLYSNSNLLIIYGLALMLIQLVLRICKQYYSRRKFDECSIQFKRYVDKSLLKSILAFTGWNLFGSIAAMSVTQVRTIILNMFFGVRVNAAEGVANTVSFQVNNVAASMTRAINPQLMKSEGSGNREKMIQITTIGSKYSAFLFALFGIPVLLESNYLFALWLKKVPDFAVLFCQLTIIGLLIEKFTFQITNAIRAVGKIRNFQVMETMIIVLIIPLAYIAFKKGFEPTVIYVIGLFLGGIVFFERLYFGKKIAGIPTLDYIKKAILPILLPILIATSIVCFYRYFMDTGPLRLVVVVFGFVLLLTFIFWLIGINSIEKQKFKDIFKSICKKMKIIK